MIINRIMYFSYIYTYIHIYIYTHMMIYVFQTWSTSSPPSKNTPAPVFFQPTLEGLDSVHVPGLDVGLDARCGHQRQMGMRRHGVHHAAIRRQLPQQLLPGGTNRWRRLRWEAAPDVFGRKPKKKISEKKMAFCEHIKTNDVFGSEVWF